MERLQLYEWEYLATTREFNSNVKLEKPGLTLTGFKLFRESKYQIICEVKGKITPGGNYTGSLNNAEKLKAGEFMTGLDFEAVTPGMKYMFLNAFFESSVIDANGNLTAKIYANKINVVWDFQDKAKTIIEYFLNCPIQRWNRATSRTYLATGQLKRLLRSNENVSLNEYSTKDRNESNTRDHLIIKNKYGMVLFCEVDRGKNAENHGSCYLEFYELEKSASKSLRDNWADALSFITGKRLINVGFSQMNEAGYINRQELNSGYSLDFEHETNYMACSPFKYTDERLMVDEEKVSKLVEAYIDDCEKYNLKEVMWKVWYSRCLPIGLDVVALGTALEMLSSAWFDEKRVKNSGCFVDADEFVEKMKNVFELIEKELPKKGGWEKVAKKIQYSNQVGITYRNLKFFDEVGLQIGKVEEEAMNARNKYAHGGYLSVEDERRCINLTRAYETLISRVILKLLGYTGKYIDYSTYGFPERLIEEPLGGPNGNGSI